VFEHICKIGLEGIVSKRRDMRAWIKVVNRESAAMKRYDEGGRF
jgi:ATP-dependent DNA ligase